MTSINTFQDILDALEQNPAMVDAMRRRLLPDELLALPQQFAEFVRMTQENNHLVAQRLENLEAGQAQLYTRVSGIETDVAEIKVTLSRMSGDLGRLIGSDYEGFATNLAVRAVRREFGIVQARNVAQQSPKDISYINRLNNEAAENGIITDYEADDLEVADVIVMGQTGDGAPVYVLAEISVTVHAGGVARAAVLQRASGVRAIPMVIGTALSAQAAADAESAGVAFVALEQSAPT